MTNNNKKLDLYRNYNEYFKNFLGGWSFENGDELLTIKDVTTEEMYDAQTGGKKQAPCLHFEEKDLPMVLNKTNSDTVAKVTGSEIPIDWIGKQIYLGQERGRWFGKESIAIRVRDIIPTKTVEPKATAEQVAKIRELIESGAIANESAMLDYYGIQSIEDMSEKQAKKLIKQKTEAF